MRVEEADGCNHQRHAKRQRNRLNGGHGCARGIFLPDAASDHGGGGKAEPDGNAEHQSEERFGEAHGGYSVLPEFGDKEGIDDAEQRLHSHFQHHGNCQKDNGAPERTDGVVAVRPVERILKKRQG